MFDPGPTAHCLAMSPTFGRRRGTLPVPLYVDLLPLPPNMLAAYLVYLAHAGKSPSTLWSVIAAVGTFQAFLNLSRRKAENFAYILAGASR